MAPTADASAAGTRVAPGVYLTEAASVKASAPSKNAPASKLQSRIVGGDPIDISQAPWQAALTVNPAIYAGNSFERLICGGSLVTPTLIVSAAHCLVDPRTSGLWADGELAAVTGRTQLSSDQGQEIPVSRFFLFTDAQGNPLYTGQTSAWDISVVELAQPSSAGTIKVAGPDEAELWALGRRVDVTGWGAIKFEGVGSDLLRSAELAVLPDPHCARSLPGQFDDATSLCAGVISGKRDSCQGDSGGPLVAPTADGRARLVGDVESGFECARPQNPGFYGRLGADPVRSALRNGVLQISGVDIQGSGAQPPTTLTRNQALELALVHSDNQCAKLQGCRQFAARQCRPQGGGFLCLIENFAKTRRQGKFTCSRTVFWSAATGTIERENAGRRTCSPGG